MEEKRQTSLPFGKHIPCGNYYVLKHTVAIGKNELKKLRDAQGIPPEVQKHLNRGVLPYITIGTVADSWKISFVCGMTMYNAIDELAVLHDGTGKYYFKDPEKATLQNLCNFWMCATSTVGDEQFQADVINAMHSYLDRMADENKEPLTEEENKKVLDESESDEKHRATIIEMSNEIKKGGDDARRTD